MVPEPLAIRRLSAQYGPQAVLNAISFTVPPRQICAVLGPSGCGKSTLLKHAVGLLTPTSGEVELFGQPLSRCTAEERAKLLQRVGLLFQGGALMHSISVVENVALPLTTVGGVDRPWALEAARLKLEMVGLGHVAFAMPNTLSGGMKKRAALARAMALDPELLFCDEPSAGLDPVTAAELDQLILHLRDRLGMTVVLVTHELPSILAIADRVLMLHEGGLIADGTVAQVRADPHPAIGAFFARSRRPEAASGRNLWDTLSGPPARVPNAPKGPEERR